MMMVTDDPTEELRSGAPLRAPVFVFTDIQGSTSMMEAEKQAMRQAVSLHNECLRSLKALYRKTTHTSGL